MVGGFKKPVFIEKKKEAVSLPFSVLLTASSSFVLSERLVIAYNTPERWVRHSALRGCLFLHPLLPLFFHLLAEKRSRDLRELDLGLRGCGAVFVEHQDHRTGNISGADDRIDRACVTG